MVFGNIPKRKGSDRPAIKFQRICPTCKKIFTTYKHKVKLCENCATKLGIKSDELCKKKIK
jgi:transcriptional regulator NrdR family protein